MNILKCKLCREPFHGYGLPICPACKEQLDKDFTIVREYIYKNPNQANAGEIAEATGIKEAHIVYLLEEGRLSADDGTGVAGFGRSLKCQVCGRSISSGTLCDSCKSSLTKELGINAQTGQAAKTGPYVSPRSSKSGSS